MRECRVLQRCDLAGLRDQRAQGVDARVGVRASVRVGMRVRVGMVRVGLRVCVCMPVRVDLVMRVGVRRGVRMGMRQRMRDRVCMGGGMDV